MGQKHLTKTHREIIERWFGILPIRESPASLLQPGGRLQGDQEKLQQKRDIRCRIRAKTGGLASIKR